MNRLNNTIAAYKRIFTDQAPSLPFTDFWHELEAVRPTVEEMEHASCQDNRRLRAIDSTRYADTFTRGEINGRRFRGSGIILAGTADGITAVSYRQDGLWPEDDPEDLGDPVAGRYPGYQYVALRKVGTAALAGRIAPFRSPSDVYLAVNDVLVDRGLLADPEVPHHLGYIATYSGLMVGASGMLPSAATASGMELRYGKKLEQDRESGWVEWERDYFAGYHDLVAATLASGGEPSAARTLLVDPRVNTH